MTLPIQSATATGGAAPVQAPAAAKGMEKKDAEGFERLLLAQLSKTLVEGATGEGSGSGVTGVYADLLPEALTQALMDGGGIGLAKTLEDAS